MNPSAIYSKSGKGVQEAAGKTSHLARPDRAVLAAIDGRATLAEVAQKVGKTFDAGFEKLVVELDKGGFIREVSPGTPAAAGAKPGAAAPKPAAKLADPASDLDFTSVMQVRPGKVPPPQSPPKPAAPPPKPSVNIPPAPPPPSAAEKAKAEQAAKAQQDAFTKAREEAERKATAERDRIKAEAEAKLRAETEAKMRQQAKEDADRKFAEQVAAKVAAEKKAVAEAAEAKIRAERDAAAKKVREEAERVRREAEEKAEKVRQEAERARKEAEEKARREQEELRRKLEEERKAREEAERKAKEEARRLEEERRKLEEERRQREEEKRREEQERAERRKREEEEEARARAERKKREEEEEAREQAEREARRKAQAKEEEKAKEVEFSLPDLDLAPVPKAPEPVKAAPPPPPAGGGGFSDSLLADLDSFSTRDDQEQKEREEQLRKEKEAKEAAAQRAREAEERRQHEMIEQMQREEKERKKQEERERKAKDEAELKQREEKEKQRLQEEEEKRAKEAEERAKKAKQEESLAASSQRGAQFDLEQRKKREAALQSRSVRTKSEVRATKGGWGKPVAITLFLLLGIAFGVAHVMPIDTSEYERGATEALGQPVKIGSANLSLISGSLQLKFHNVSFGDTRIAELRGFPEFDSLLGPKKVFTRIEIDGAKVPQEVLGPALFAKVRADNFTVARVLAKNLELVGPLAMPKGLELDAIYNGDGTVRTAFLRGPEALVVKLEPKGSSIEVEMSAATFTLPFAPEVSFGRFSAKGSMNSRGFNIAEWDAAALNGTLSGTAAITWDETWTVEGVVTARNINAAVFAPALLSDGRGEGSAKFSMRGPQPAKLGETARIDGTFTVSRGVLGSFDLARAVQSQGKVSNGRTQFSEMTGNAVYDRGTVALRNVTIGAGQLNAGASADIAQNGALSGRIVADMRVATQQIRATLQIGGTVREPQVRN